MDISLTNKSKISVVSAIALSIGGLVLSTGNYNNLFASLLIILSIIGFWLSQEHPRSKLSTIGLVTSILGIIFSVMITSGNSYFYQLRNDPSLRTGNNVIGFLFGVTSFCGMLLFLILGFIFLGISILRSSDLPKLVGVFFILAGIVAFASNAAGIMLGIAGIIWLSTPLKAALRTMF